MERASVVVSLLLLVSCSLAVSADSALDVNHQEYTKYAASRSIEGEAGHDHRVHCSRERSRAAWKIIEEYLMPFVEQEKFQMSSRCRLHPDNYMFRDQEEHKIHVNINDWRCGYCKKSFRAEKFLDQHFDNRHHSLLNVSKNHCLGDLCGALHCDHLVNSKSTKTKCNPAAAARNHHLCETIADHCFPVNHGLSASHLHDFFLHQFCDAHTCSGKRKIFPRGGKKQPNIVYLSISILTLMLLPLFYLLVYLQQREERGRQEFKRIRKIEKTRPSSMARYGIKHHHAACTRLPERYWSNMQKQNNLKV